MSDAGESKKKVAAPKRRTLRKAEEGKKTSRPITEWQPLRKERYLVERQLRDLHQIGHLGHGPKSVGKSWDSGSKRAFKEFLGTLEDTSKTAVSKELVDEIKKRHDLLFFKLLLLDPEQDADSGEDESSDEAEHKKREKSRLKEYRTAAGYSWSQGFYILNYYEDQIVKVESVTARKVTIEFLDGEGKTLLKKDQVDTGQEVNLGSLAEGMPLGDLASLPVVTSGTVRCSFPDPVVKDSTIRLELNLTLSNLRNVGVIKDDRGREFLIHQDAVEPFIKLKKAVNDANGGKGKLRLNSTLRLFPHQLALWKGRQLQVCGLRRGSFNRAAQPGKSRHESGTGMDVDIFGLTISADVPKLTGSLRSTLKRTKHVESPEEREPYEPFYEQLEQFRGMAKDSGLETIWNRYPWCKGKQRTRREATIESATYSKGLKYTFRFELTKTGAGFLSKQKIGTRKGRIEFRTGEGNKDVLGFDISTRRSRMPTRLWPKGMSKSKQQGPIPEIVWTVDARKFGATSFKWIEAHIQEASIHFEWSVRSKSRKTSKSFKVEADGLSVKMAREDAFVTLAGKLTESTKDLGVGAADPIQERVQIELKSEKAKSSTGPKLKATSDFRLASDGVSFALELSYKSISKQVALPISNEKESFAGCALSIVTEDKTLHADPHHDGGKRYLPALQGGNSEKHHFQVSGSASAPAKWGETIQSVNDLIDAYNEEIAGIEGLWLDKHKDGDDDSGKPYRLRGRKGKKRKVRLRAPRRVRKIESSLKMRHYSSAFEVTRLAASVGNFPPPDAIEVYLNETIEEIKKLAGVE